MKDKKERLERMINDTPGVHRLHKTPDLHESGAYTHNTMTIRHLKQIVELWAEVVEEERDNVME